MQSSHRIVGLCLVLAVATGCSTPPAIPADFQVPPLAASQIPRARAAILDYARSHDGRLPDTSLGEQIVLRTVDQLSQTVEEVDSTGVIVTRQQFIDGVAYAFRPAQSTFILAIAGRVVRSASAGGAGGCAWFCFVGRYDDSGHLILDQTTYVDNAELFVDAMRATTHRASWNSSAWAITKCNHAMVASSGDALADGMVAHFVQQAIATGRARVPNGMPPRQAAFGGVAQPPR
ncbi:MAG: hypothetical protein EXS01_01100 [Phycisphaerales bacterium]|nr:hypothetical protein [Phycisphaerales bacterium]